MSRGQQFLQINSAECLNRAVQALRNVGFLASTSGNFAEVFKEISCAYIICNDGPGGGTAINIIVSSGTNDAGVPGSLRHYCRRKCSRGGTPANCALVGNWVVICCNEG